MAELRYRTRRRRPNSRHRRRHRRSVSTFTDDLDVADAALLSRRRAAHDPPDQAAGGRLARWRARRGDTQALDKLDTQIDDKFDLADRTQHRSLLRQPPPDRHAISPTTNMPPSAPPCWPCCWRRASPCSCAGASSGRCRPPPPSPTASPRANCRPKFPPGGADETGALLKSMTVMQDNIREMMTRETCLRRSAENRLADALETSREGVILVAPDGKIVLANSALRDFFPAIAELAGQRRSISRGAGPDPDPAWSPAPDGGGIDHIRPCRTGTGRWPLGPHDRQRHQRRRLDHASCPTSP